MRVLVKVSTQAGSVFRRLPLGARSDGIEPLLQDMLKHVGRDGSVSRLYVEFENERLQITHERELLIVAQLATAYSQALTAEQWAHEKDLYGAAYSHEDKGEGGGRIEKSGATSGTRGKQEASPGLAAQNFCTVKTRTRARARRTKGPSEEVWDEEKKGDRFVFDPQYEQNEDLLPWNMPGNEERFSWYM